MADKQVKKAVRLEKDEKISSGVFDRVDVWRGNVSGEYHVSSKNTDKMEKNHQKVVKKAAAAKARTQKTVYRFERVYDSSTGRYTFQTVSHRVDKDYGKRNKSKGKKGSGFIVSKGKDAIQAAWRSASQIEAGNGGIQDSASDAANAVFETTKKGIYAAGVLKEDIFKYNKNRAVKLQNKADFSKFQLEGRKGFEKEFANKVREGKISQDNARRAMQKEIIKKKYQSRAVLQYAQQKSKAVAFITSSAARKKMLEAAAAATKKYLIIGAAVAVLLCVLLGGCAVIVISLFGGGSTVSLGVYLANHEELEKAENYFNQLEMLLAESICNFEEELFAVYADTHNATNGVWTAPDGTEWRLVVEYDLNAIHHDPTVLINYLTVMFNDFKINMYDLNFDTVANEIVNPLFYNCYGVAPNQATDGVLAEDIVNGFDYGDILSICDGPYESGPYTEYTPRRDSAGQLMYDENTGEIIKDEYHYMECHFKVGGSYTFRSLEDVVQERINGFGSELQSRYGLISETNGALQQAVNIMGEDIDIHERVIDYYGNYLTDTDYTHDGWSPHLVKPPDGQSRVRAIRNYVSLQCDSGGNYIYAGMNGTVTAVGSGTVTIENESSGILSANNIIFENLNTVNVAQNQTVTPNTVIGSCNNKLYIYYQETEGLSGTTYRNPLFYFK